MLNAIQLSRIDLNLLVLLHVVLEEGQVGRAAQRLSLTPSAVSHGLTRLRRLLADPLFLRTPRGVVPTERALGLRQPVAEILGATQAVLAAATPFDAARSSRRFVIGAPDAVLAAVAPPLLARLAVQAPSVDLALVQLMPRRRERPGDEPWLDSLEQLERRALDLALLPIAAPPTRFDARRLYDERFVVVMRRGHPFARQPTLARYAAAAHLLVSASGDPRGIVDDLLEARGLQRRIALTVPSFALALELAAGGDLLATLPARLADGAAARHGLAVATLPLPRAPDPIQAVATRAALQDAGVAWLREAVVAAAGGATGPAPAAARRRASSTPASGRRRPVPRA